MRPPRAHGGQNPAAPSLAWASLPRSRGPVPTSSRGDTSRGVLQGLGSGTAHSHHYPLEAPKRRGQWGPWEPRCALETSCVHTLPVPPTPWSGRGSWLAREEAQKPPPPQPCPLLFMPQNSWVSPVPAPRCPCPLSPFGDPTFSGTEGPRVTCVIAQASCCVDAGRLEGIRGTTGSATAPRRSRLPGKGLSGSEGTGPSRHLSGLHRLLPPARGRSRGSTGT